MYIPEGWCFNSSDFSCLAAGRRELGSVLLVRDPGQKEIWHKKISEIEDEELWPILYVTGYGNTFEEAIDDTVTKAMNIGMLSDL